MKKILYYKVTFDGLEDRKSKCFTDFKNAIDYANQTYDDYVCHISSLGVDDYKNVVIDKQQARVNIGVWERQIVFERRTSIAIVKLLVKKQYLFLEDE